MQSSALGLEGEPFEDTCQTALKLYGLAENEANHLFEDRQEHVIRYARKLSTTTP